jgi:resuscitation-promoting factor RpfA
MVGRTARATLLGATGTLLMGAAACWLLRAARAAWPGAAPSQLEAGLEFLAVGAAGVVTAWVTVLLTGATLSLLASSGRSDHAGGTTAPATAVARGLTGRVAAALLVAASLGAAPAAAQARPVILAAEARPAAVASSQAVRATTLGDAAPLDASPGSPEPDEVPLPGWTPTVGSQGELRRTPAEVGLVSTTASAGVQHEVVVHRGDTLWDIAARHLGEHATDQDVAEEWPRWYAVNRDLIGGDPDLIRPGQRLVVPSAGVAR